MAKPSIYIETTVISYYTSRPSRDVVVAGHQATTIQWWEQDLPKFSPFISQVVIDEIATGDADASERRLAAVKNMNALELTEGVGALAIEYFDAITLPETARADALHLAIGTWHGMDYLVSWNCKHIASARVRKIVEQINSNRQLATPVICTPEELLEF